MITRIHLENFRRHQDTDIVLAPDEQIIAVSGRNGTGKSTLLEAIMFALFGQSRHGARGLDRLIRRGGELEGMSVELEFTVGDDRYHVTRRRDGKAVSAVMSVNDIPLVEGPKAVTEAVVNLLGVDAAGFRLASVAQQKELDAIVKLGGPARVRAISKLLRLDAVTRAKDDLARNHRKIVDILGALPTPAERHELAVAVADAEAAVAAAHTAETATKAEIARLEQHISRGANLEQTWQQARDALADAEANLRTATSNLTRLEAARADLTARAGATVDTVDFASIAQRASEIARDLSDAERVEEAAQQRAMIVSEITASRADIDAANLIIAQHTGIEIAEAAEQAEQQLADARSDLAAARLIMIETADRCSVARNETSRLTRRVEALQTLDGLCDTCGQTIDDDHKHSIVDDAQQQLADAQHVYDLAEQQLNAADRAVNDAEQTVTVCELAARTAAEAVRTHFEAESRKAHAQQRLDVYQGRLDRLGDPSTVDVTALRERKRQIDAEVEAAQTSVAAERDRAAAHLQLVELDAAIETARSTVAAADEAVASLQIGDSLIEQWEAHRAAIAAHRAELSVLAELTAATQAARGELKAAQVNAANNEQIAANRSRHQHAGRIAGLAKRAVEQLEHKVGSDVIPSLESAASDLIEKLSDGRFTAVKLDNEYTPSVDDQGAFRPVSDLSGGEQDLVALAVRLAVADVVTERNDTVGGFLILDEVLGSQDHNRRESILAALRTLKSRYGQIWCISHVGGIEDVADRVIDIDVDADGIAHAS